MAIRIIQGDSGRKVSILEGDRKLWPSELYRVIQEERSVFWEVIISVTVSKSLIFNVCLIVCDCRDGAV